MCAQKTPATSFVLITGANVESFKIIHHIVHDVLHDRFNIRLRLKFETSA